MPGRTKASVISWLVGIKCGCWNLLSGGSFVDVFMLWKEEESGWFGEHPIPFRWVCRHLMSAGLPAAGRCLCYVLWDG